MRGARLVRVGAIVAGLVLLSGCAWIAQVDTPRQGGGPVANALSGRHWLSPTGRYVVFDSTATNLVPGTGGEPGSTTGGVFLRDQRTGRTTLVRAGASLTEDPGVSNGLQRILMYAPGLVVLDRPTGVTEPVTVNTDGTPISGSPTVATMSRSGRYVAFRQARPNGNLDTFIRDLQADATALVTSLPPVPASPGRNQLADTLSLNGDGSVLSQATCNASANGQGGVPFCTLWNLQIFHEDGPTESPLPDQASRFSARLDGTGTVLAYANGEHLWARTLATGVQQQIDAGSTEPNLFFEPSISADGRYVAFDSDASGLVPGVNPLGTTNHIYVRDRVLNQTTLVSADAFGDPLTQFQLRPVISGDGRYVTFKNFGTGLTPGGEQTFRTYTKVALIPRISSVAPGQGARGTTVLVTITGSGFRPDSIVHVGDGATVTAANVAVTETSIQANLTIPAGAAVAEYNVAVFTPGSGPGTSAGAAASCAGCFDVTP